jgi:hypothetical protein
MILNRVVMTPSGFTRPAESACSSRGRLLMSRASGRSTVTMFSRRKPRSFRSGTGGFSPTIHSTKAHATPFSHFLAVFFCLWSIWSTFRAKARLGLACLAPRSSGRTRAWAGKKDGKINSPAPADRARQWLPHATPAGIYCFRARLTLRRRFSSWAAHDPLGSGVPRPVLSTREKASAQRECQPPQRNHWKSSRCDSARAKSF